MYVCVCTDIYVCIPSIMVVHMYGWLIHPLLPYSPPTPDSPSLARSISPGPYRRRSEGIIDDLDMLPHTAAPSDIMITNTDNRATYHRRKPTLPEPGRWTLTTTIGKEALLTTLTCDLPPTSSRSNRFFPQKTPPSPSLSPRQYWSVQHDHHCGNTNQMTADTL